MTQRCLLHAKASSPSLVDTGKRLRLRVWKRQLSHGPGVIPGDYPADKKTNFVMNMVLATVRDTHGADTRVKQAHIHTIRTAEFHVRYEHTVMCSPNVDCTSTSMQGRPRRSLIFAALVFVTPRHASIEPRVRLSFDVTITLIHGS